MVSISSVPQFLFYLLPEIFFVKFTPKCTLKPLIYCICALMYLCCQCFLIGPAAEKQDLQAHMLLRSYYMQTSVRLTPHCLQSLTAWLSIHYNTRYLLLSKVKRLSFESISPRGISPASKEAFLKERFLFDNDLFCALWKHLQCCRPQVLNYHLQNLRRWDLKIEFSCHSVLSFTFAWICAHRLEEDQRRFFCGTAATGKNG